MLRATRVRLTNVSTLVLCLAVSSMVLTAGVSQAAPRADLAQVQAQVNDLQHVAESATERYNEANANFKSVNSQLQTLKSKAAR